jgi:ATP-dependent Clp protease ATP-binding subunit ClpC
LSDTQIIVKGVREGFTSHHHIDISAAVADRIVTLAERYLPERSNPDIAIEIMDAACVEARIANADALQAEHALTVVERMAHLPPGFLRQNERQRYLTLEETLNSEVFDQPRATKVLSQSMKVSSTGIGEPNRPSGIFGFVGPTGTGKTETADCLARHLGLSLTRLDMSQYMERHTVAGLIGAPPGYAGYEDEGMLTGPVRRRPFNVILLDEFEKAHEEVFKILMPIFDKGVINDAAGRRVDFRHTIFILSMNLDAHTIFAKYHADPEHWTNTDNALIHGAFDNKLKERYPPEFINRLDETVIFNPLRPRTMFRIAERETNKLKQRTLEAQNVSVTFDPTVIEKLGEHGYSPEYGARPLKRLITQEVTVPLANAILTHPAESPVRNVHFSLNNECYVMDLL